MKVLMFGWEFPPHISGGLGTACLGLTQSLSHQDVDIVFVVPKLHGDEAPQPFTLVDASKVSFSPADHGSEFLPPPELRGNAHPPTEISTATKMRTKSQPAAAHEARPRPAKGKVTIIEVPSYLSAYATPAMPLHTGRRVRHPQHPAWQSPSETRGTDVADIAIEYPADVSSTAIAGYDEPALLYNFSGKYGPDLLTETKYFAKVAASLAQQHTFDVIHVHDWMTFPAGLAAKKVSGKPLVVHVHSTEFDRSGETPFPEIFAIEKEGMQGADVVVTVSGWTKRIVETKFNITPSKVKVAYNGVIPKEMPTPTADHPFGSHVVTFLGRLTYQKGPIYFVQAAARVLKRFPDAHFVVGGSGDLFNQIVAEAARLRISSRFHFTGFLKGDNVQKLWSITKLYVMPSVSEPFGITPLEAIQADVPVILSNQSGVSEVMPHAIKVDFWNVDALSNAICNVLAHESLSQTLRANSQVEIQQITWGKTAKRIKAIYHELTA